MNFFSRIFLAFYMFQLPWGAGADILDKQKLLEAQTFWDNRDWGWYKANIPFFECPDLDINTTYYYRWELTTKHLTYGSPNSGYSYTEFIDRPFWSGAYGAISCPAGHQLYEVRWLRDARFARDYSRYWFRTPGAQPRNYSTWLADAIWAVHLVHPDKLFVTDLLPDLEANYAGWEQRHYVPQMGMFWQIGHDDGMEFNINSRQTMDIVRGAPGYRPSFNAYMWADAQAIASIAELKGDVTKAAAYRTRAVGLKDRLQQMLWDPKREFFFHMFQKQEKDKDGNIVRALTRTHESGKYAGSPHGREEIGFVPWQFNLPDRGFESAWKFLMDPEYFYADFGPLTVERHDPMFHLEKTCCWWSGQSWPYATTQTLKALANLLQNYQQGFVTRQDYLKLLRIYALTHRKNGRPYIAEAANPDTGSFAGHDSYNHSEHYFHSGFNDLIITGLIGLKPRADETLELDPLAPADWNYFALDDLPYHGHRLAVVWDKSGTRYGLGAGLHVLADGKSIGASEKLGKFTVQLPSIAAPLDQGNRFNYAVNNDGDYYPHLSASAVGPKSSLSSLVDGNYWYHENPPNRWTCDGSTNATDFVILDFGTGCRIDTLKLYFLDDGEKITAPADYKIEFFSGSIWRPISKQRRTPSEPAGHCANIIQFPLMAMSRLRIVFTHATKGKTGLTEIEAWGPGAMPYQPVPPPVGNFALNRTGQDFPKATASFTDRYGGNPMAAIDGKVIFRPNPMNRWTSYGSTNLVDWLEVDFGAPRTIGRIELSIYDDHGGVQAPATYNAEYWQDGAWRAVEQANKFPVRPTGGIANTLTFKRVQASKVRIVFQNQNPAKSGVTELEAWSE